MLRPGPSYVLAAVFLILGLAFTPSQKAIGGFYLGGLFLILAVFFFLRARWARKHPYG